MQRSFLYERSGLPSASEIDQGGLHIDSDLLRIFKKCGRGESVCVAVFPRRLLAVASVHKFGHCPVNGISFMRQIDVIPDVVVIETDLSVLNPGGEGGGAAGSRQMERTVMEGDPAGHVPERPDTENDKIF